MQIKSGKKQLFQWNSHQRTLQVLYIVFQINCKQTNAKNEFNKFISKTLKVRAVLICSIYGYLYKISKHNSISTPKLHQPSSFPICVSNFLNSQCPIWAVIHSAVFNGDPEAAHTNNIKKPAILNN
jgi:hypothetical protein